MNFKKGLKKIFYRIKNGWYSKKTKHNGYTIEVADGFYPEDGSYHQPYYLTFPSFEDYRKVGDIEMEIYELNN